MADEIKASPQGALAGFLGSLGQTAYRAGRGMDEGMQPLRANHPVKTTLAEFLLASPLRSAGNALQDWTGTPRYITPEEPYARLLSGKGMTTRLDPRVLDVAEFAYPVAGRLMGTIRGLPAALKDAALAAYGPMATASYAIKPKGGNWLPEGTKALESLKPHRYAADDKKMFEAELADLMEQEARTPGRNAARIPVVQGSIAEINRHIEFNNWIDKQLTRYVKNDMATPEDPIRALAEKGTLHFDAPQVNTYQAGRDMKRQEFAAGNDGKWGYGTSRLAQNWEDAADAIINKVPAERYQKQQFNRFDMTNEPGWEFINKISPDTPLYGINNPSSVFGNSIDSLGFPHLIDELRNATNPASGLPRELMLKPESLSKLSVPQAVERVAKINEWRAAQMEVAKKASREGIPVHKEYPEGYKWMASPDTVADAKALQYIQDVGCEGGWCTQGENLAKQYGGEGNQLYVLHDPSGKAVTQISVEKNQNPYPVSGEAFARLTGPEKAEYREHVMQWRRRNPDVDELTDEHTAQALKEAGVQPQPDRIVEIKGKQNRAPNEEYLPYVQDFVRSGKWSGVGDPENAGLRRYWDVFNVNEQRGIEAAGEAVPEHDWLTGEEIQRLHNAIYPEGQRLTYGARGNIVDNGLKRGGLVTQAEIDAASKPYMMPVPKRRGSIDLSGAKAAGTMLSGMAASIPAGYAGALELLRTRDPKMAADASEAMQERYMSIPDDPRTIEKVEGLAKYLEPLSVPAQYIGEKALRLFGDPLAATAAEMVLDPLNYLPAIGKAPAAAKAVGRAVSKIANAELAGRSGLSGQRGAITYHGSPHLLPPTAKNPLGEFDPTKIGTGQGAQTYGHGLYVAENPKVADRLEYRDPHGLYARITGDMNNREEFAHDMLSQGRKPADVFQMMKQKYGQFFNDRMLWADLDKVSPKGNLYKVDLPDEHIARMLDWDNTLSEQHPHIQDIINKIADADSARYGEGGGMDYYRGDPDSHSGESIYRYLQEQNDTPKQASEFLRQKGIPGLKYLDAGSREAGEGTRNFVVFPGSESLMNILERNGVTAESLRNSAPSTRMPEKIVGAYYDAEKFASGGLVEYHPLDVDARVDELKRELFNG